MPSCPACGAEIPETATYCPDCGAALDGTAEDVDSASLSSDAVTGFITGFLAVGIGFLLTAVVADDEENRELAAELLASTGPGGVSISRFLPEWYQIIGWVFLENHQVDVSVRVGEEFSNGDWIGTYADALLPAASELQAVPPLLLLCAGYFVASRHRRTSPLDAFVSGATVTAGYLPGIITIVVIATFEVVLPIVDIVAIEIAPHLGRAILIAGIAYPVIFGGIGGLLTFIVERR